MRLYVAAFVVAGLAGVAAGEEGRPLKMEVVDQIIEQNDRAVQACGRGFRHDTLAVLMRLEIDVDGHVLTAAPMAKPSAEAACLARVARRIHFPSTGLPSQIEYPFMLNPTLRR